jgi:hypothetical protein
MGGGSGGREGSTRERMSDYDPVECLRAEVQRFYDTNTFTPMLVTNFYAQARCVITEIEMLRGEVKMLRQYKAMAVEREQAMRIHLNANRRKET